MSYFDHVRCPECSAEFSPERVESRGGVMACPKCGAGLQLKNLFGLGAAFVEQETPDLELDDLIPEGDRHSTWFGMDEYGRFPGQEPPQPRQRKSAPAAKQEAAPVARTKGKTRPALTGPAPVQGSSPNLPARKAGHDYTDGGGASALDVLRGMKKK